MKAKGRTKSRNGRNPKIDESSPVEERLNRFLARAGYASRREGEDYIRDGLVTVNGRIVRDPAARVNPEGDAVKVKGKRIFKLPSYSYYVLYKPRNMVCTMEDPQGRPCLGDLLKRTRGRPVPAGRLDFDTEGLVFCTNDGDMIQKIMHPRFKVRKVYNVKVSGVPDQRVLERLRKGVVLDGRKTLPAKVSVLKQSERTAWIRMTLYEGRNRQVKRMMAHFGYRVLKLQRVALGPLSLQGMERGDIRKLTVSEIGKLKAFAEQLDKTGNGL